MKQTFNKMTIALFGLLLCTAPALWAQTERLTVVGNEVDLTTTGNVTGSGITSAVGSVHYNHSTKTLTLNNASISNTGMGDDTGIKSEVTGLIIFLEGDNTITADWAGIHHTQSLTITGSGKLEISTGSMGIYGSSSSALNIEGGCTVIATGNSCGIAGDDYSELSWLIIKNSTVKATGRNRGSIVDISSLTLEGCAIISPAGAQHDTQYPAGIYHNDTLVRNEVVIDVANTSRYITLDVTPGDSIKLGFLGFYDSTSIKIVSGAMKEIVIANGFLGGDIVYKKYFAGDETMTIYGDVANFDCSGNTSHITGIDISHHTNLMWLFCQDNSISSLDATGQAYLAALICYDNNFTTQALDELYCTLPHYINPRRISPERMSEEGRPFAKICPVYGPSSPNHSIVMATTKENAFAKYRKIVYYNEREIPATTGNYVCGSTTGVEQLQANEAAARIYPNPVSDWLTIETDETIETLQLFDLAGRLLLSQTPQSRAHTLDVSALQSGVYMLKISGKSGSSVQKVIKK